MIKRVFGEPERRDPEHRRTWVALGDGANDRIERITSEVLKRTINVAIVADLSEPACYREPPITG